MSPAKPARAAAPKELLSSVAVFLLECNSTARRAPLRPILPSCCPLALTRAPLCCARGPAVAAACPSARARGGPLFAARPACPGLGLGRQALARRSHLRRVPVSGDALPSTHYPSLSLVYASHLAAPTQPRCFAAPSRARMRRSRAHRGLDRAGFCLAAAARPPRPRALFALWGLGQLPLASRPLTMRRHCVGTRGKNCRLFKHMRAAARRRPGGGPRASPAAAAAALGDEGFR